MERTRSTIKNLRVWLGEHAKFGREGVRFHTPSLKDSRKLRHRSPTNETKVRRAFDEQGNCILRFRGTVQKNLPTSPLSMPAGVAPSDPIWEKTTFPPDPTSLRLPTGLALPESPQPDPPVLEEFTQLLPRPQWIKWLAQLATATCVLLILCAAGAPFLLSYFSNARQPDNPYPNTRYRTNLPLGGFNPTEFGLDKKELAALMSFQDELQRSILFDHPERADEIYNRCIQTFDTAKPRFMRATGNLFAAYLPLVEAPEEIQYELLEPFYSRQLDEAPKDPEALLAKASFLLRFGFSQDAIAILRHAMRFDPTNITLKRTLAKLLLDRGDKKGAIDLAITISESGASELIAKRFTLSFLLDLGLDEEALETCNYILQLDSTDLDTRNKRDHISERLRLRKANQGTQSPRNPEPPSLPRKQPQETIPAGQ